MGRYNKIQISNLLSGIFVDNYYIWIICIYILTLFIKQFPVGVCAAFFMLVVGFINVMSGKLRRIATALDVWVTFFVIYCLMSAVWIIIYNVNIIVYIKAVSNSILPVVFYFCARNGIGSLYRGFLKAVNICCIIGIILLGIMPGWYQAYCIDYGYSFTRLSSCVGSTAVGTLSVIAMLISIRLLYLSKGKKGKTYYLLSILYAFCSMQRSAWIVMSITLVIMHWLLFFKWKTIRLRIFVVEILCMLVCIIFSWSFIWRLVSRWILEHEISGGFGMFASRSSQWIEALKTTNLLFGNGYGTVGHKAIGYVDSIVADGSWICLLCEIGFIGITIFLIMICYAIIKGTHILKRKFLPVGIIVCVALQAIGSNMFEYQIIMPIFWYAIGDINSQHNFNIKSEVSKNENTGYVSATIS